MLTEIKPEWLKTRDPEVVLPLYRKASTAPGLKEAFIEIDVETGRVSTALEEPGSEPRSRVERGFVQRVPVDPTTIGGALEEFLASEETHRLVQRVVSGAKIYVYDFTRRAELNEDAQAALEELERLADELPTAIVREVDADDGWLPSECYTIDGFYFMDDIPITLSMQRELVERFPEVQYDGKRVRVFTGLHNLFAYLEWWSELNRRYPREQG